MKNRIHYLCFYTDDYSKDFLVHFPSALPKINYISKTLKELGCNVEILSVCKYKPNIKSIRGYYNSDGIFCHYLKSVPFAFGSKFETLYAWLQIFLYLLFQVKRGDRVLVYHSLYFIKPISWVLRLKNIRLTIEVEELYYSLTKENIQYKRKELVFLRKADSYLLVNDLLKQKIDIDNKPCIISYSTYESQENHQAARVCDGKIHVIYAGVIEQQRKAAFLATQAAAFLPKKYTIHILGFGQANDINDLQDYISQINNDQNNANVIYHGALYGRQYDNFLAKCHIGISCHTYSQDIPESADCTFPSKVFVYLTHGLRVVSLPLRCLEESAISQLIEFAKDDSPQSLAAAIEQTSLDVPYEGQKRVEEMNQIFKMDINRMFNNEL